MADPGDEWKRSYAYRDDVMQPWLAANGLPPVTVISRRSEEVHRPRTMQRGETLYEECVRIASLPSVAYGFKKCSQKEKARPFQWWCERQDWAQSSWQRGEKIVRAIGYDAGEERRVRAKFEAEAEAARYVPRYPLVEAGYDREDCERLIRDAGLPLPHKSACTFCANNTLEEWEELRREEPEAFARAVALSRGANIEVPDVVGLMRCNPHGKRQLHVWAEGGYGACRGGREDPMPCECAT
jgi:hypothetical protein